MPVVIAAQQERRPSQNKGLATVYARAVMPTYAFALTTCQRRVLFSKAQNAALMMDILFRYRDEGRYLLHGFAIMPVQVYVLLTPCRERTIERCVRCVKDGFTAKTRLRIPGEVWQAWVLDHRVRDKEDFRKQLEIIVAIPERRNLRVYPFVHTQHWDRMDAMPVSLRVSSARVESRVTV